MKSALLAVAATLALRTGAAAQTGADTAASARWNVIARRLLLAAAAPSVSQQSRADVRSSARPLLVPRALAVVSGAQYEAQVRAAEANVPAAVAVAAATARVLARLSPRDSAAAASMLARELESRRRAGEAAARIEGARRIGDAAALAVLRFAAGDRSDSTWKGSVPKGAGMWYGTPGVPVGGAGLAVLRPWTLVSADQFRPGPPPGFTSPEFRAALDEVRRTAMARTPEQVEIAQRWAVASVPDLWHGKAVELIARHRLPEDRAARLLAVLAVAGLDAQIACWDAKLHYWVIRPTQADSTIAMPERVPLPNFPAYPSGHACAAGAVSTVLAHFVPDTKDEVLRMADEAAISRLYAGVHYRFDNDTGLALGRTIARWVIGQDAQGELRKRWR